MRSLLRLMLVVVSVLMGSQGNCSERAVVENATGITLDPLLMSQEAERNKLYMSFSRVQQLAKLLNEKYKKDKSYPPVRGWVDYVRVASGEVFSGGRGGFIEDGFGDPFIYIPISRREVWLYSINIYDDSDGVEKVTIFKLKSGRLDVVEEFEP